MKRYPEAVWMPSPNHSPRRGDRVDRVVVHISDGGPRLEHLVDRLRNPSPSSGSPVSAHFAVGRDGTIAQLVDLELAAWHCSGWNAHSVGVEHCARTPGEFDRRGRWAAMSPEHRNKLLDADTLGAGAVASDPGLPPTESQLRASARLVAWVCKELGLPADAEHVVPHCSSPTTTHSDCGRDVSAGGCWPWERYLAMLRDETGKLATDS